MADILNDMMYLRLSRNRDGTDYTQGFNPGFGASYGVTSFVAGSPTPFTTDTPHDIVVGDIVTFAGVTGADAAELNNVRFAVTAVTASTFTIAYNSTAKVLTVGSALVGIAGKIISGVTATNPVVYTTSNAHGIETGDSVTISGVTEQHVVSAVTAANPAVFTTVTPHQLYTGAQVVTKGFLGPAGVLLEGVTHTVAGIPGANQFSVAIDTSGTALKVLSVTSQFFGLASVTTANPAVFTTDAPHSLVAGDKIVFSDITGTDAGDLNGIEFTVGAASLGASTFSCGYSSTGKTLVVGAGFVTRSDRTLITTYNSHTLVSGDKIKFASLTGADAADLNTPDSFSVRSDSITSTTFAISYNKIGKTINAATVVGLASVTTANPAVFTTDAPHSLVAGNVIRFSNVGGADAADLNGIEFTVSSTSLGASTFSCGYNSTGKTLNVASADATYAYGIYRTITCPGTIQKFAAYSRANSTFMATRVSATTFSVPQDNTDSIYSPTAVAGTNPNVVVNGISKYVPVYVDGLKAGETISTKEIQTEHRTPGVRYKILTGRNADQASLTTPVHPETIKTVLGAVLQKRNGTYLPFYHTIEQYWNAAITAASPGFGDSGAGGQVYTGRCLKGCVFNGFSINIDRNSPADWSFNASMFIRREDPLTSTQPTPIWPAQDPYTTGNVYADIVFLDDDGDPVDNAATYGFSGDNLNLISVSVNYQSNLSVSLMRPSSDVAVDLSWTKLYRTAPSAAVNGQLVFNASDYLTLTRMASVRHARLRLMGVGGAPSGEATFTGGIYVTSGGSSGIATIYDTSGFSVGDYILLSQVTANIQNVAVITSIDPNLSITFAPVDPANLKFVGMTATASDPVYVKNTAWQILVPQFDIQTKEPPSSGGDYKVINFTGTARLVATLADATVDNADVVSYGAYNDDGA